MASNNDNGEMFGFAVAIAIIGMLALVLYAVLAFIAVVLTVIAILAWNKPLTLGKMSVQPADARAFVGRGVVGALAVPVFIGFCELLFDLRVDWDGYLGHFLLGGYTLGSLVVEMMTDEEKPQATGPEYLPPAPQLPSRSAPARVPADLTPFRFASWDDEAEEPGDDNPCRSCASARRETGR